MADEEVSTRECPLCREEVRVDALRCKHCQAALVPEQPDHGGTCPFCKEDIKPEAIRCKHCHADLTPGAATSGCGCGGGARRIRRVPRAASARRFVPRGSAPAGRGRLGNRGVTPALFARRSSVCPEYDIDDDGTWAYIGETEDDCIYELVDPAGGHYGVFETDDELIDPYS
jgi:hypothetical protein